MDVLVPTLSLNVQQRLSQQLALRDQACELGGQEVQRLRPAAEAYWDAVAAFTTERNHGPLSTTLGWSIRHGEIGEALRAITPTTAQR